MRHLAHMGDKRTACKVLVAKTSINNIPFLSRRRRWEDSTEMDCD
jgi:hypothetical protein